MTFSATQVGTRNDLHSSTATFRIPDLPNISSPSANKILTAQKAKLII